MQWNLIADEPTKTGEYIVGHRGTQKIIWFFADDESRDKNAIRGWKDDPRVFGATHWADYGDVPKEHPPRELLCPLPPKAVVTFTRSCAVSQILERYILTTRKHWWSTSVKTPRFTTHRTRVEKGMTGTVIKSSGHHSSLVFEIELHDGKGTEVVFNSGSGYPFTAEKFIERFD